MERIQSIRQFLPRKIIINFIVIKVNKTLLLIKKHMLGFGIIAHLFLKLSKHDQPGQIKLNLLMLLYKDRKLKKSNLSML